MIGASEGASIGQVFGRMRVAGQVIWATRFKETVTATESGGGKGGSGQQTTTVHELFLFGQSCQSHFARARSCGSAASGRTETKLRRKTLNMRVYPGSEDQLPDRKDRGRGRRRRLRLPIVASPTS